MAEFAASHLTEIDEVDDGRCVFRATRVHFGIKSFGVTTWTGRDAGDRIINEHDEEGESEELYLVHTGHARFELDGKEVDAPAGTFVFAQPGVKRTAFAVNPETTIVAVGANPGEVYDPDGWELAAPLGRLHSEGRYEEAADLGQEILKTAPWGPALLFNIACCESLAGRASDAIAHLEAAADHPAAAEKVRAMAAQDSDFDPIRDEPAFKRFLDGG